jgi:hypothetical protein
MLLVSLPLLYTTCKGFNIFSAFRQSLINSPSTVDGLLLYLIKVSSVISASSDG